MRSVILLDAILRPFRAVGEFIDDVCIAVYVSFWDVVDQIQKGEWGK